MISAALVLAAVGGVSFLRTRTAVEGWSRRTGSDTGIGAADADLRGRFALPPGDPAPVPRAAYDALADYVLRGFLAYRSPTGALVHYPGAPSEHGRRVDGLEGFARGGVVAAAWLAAGDDPAGGRSKRRADLRDALVAGLTAGSDPAGPEYWGEIGDYDQRVVEAADVALALWLARRDLWDRMDEPRRVRLRDWLLRAAQVEVPDGNWELFPLVVHRVLRSLGVDVSSLDERMRTRYEHFKSLHVGQGWFVDPPKGIDYYNSWSIHYSLFWLDRIDPGLDREFIRRALGEFAMSFKHVFGPSGMPLLGRSACYRMAAPAALIAASVNAPQAVSRGEAMRALDLTWAFFLAHGAMRDGAVTQGFCGTDLAVVDRYSGPASCLWAMRALVLAMVLDREAGLFDTAREALPVERGDFALDVPAAGWRIRGRQADGEVTIEIARNPPGDGPALVPYGWKARLSEWLLQRPRRPNNAAALYGRPSYSTRTPPVPCPPAADATAS